DNLKKAIEHSKSQPLHRLIYGLGIRLVGETTAKTLADSIHHLLDLAQKKPEDLQDLEDIGPKVAANIHAFFYDSNHISMIQKLDALGVNMVSVKKSESTGGGQLQGKTFLFTGTLPTLKRSEAEELVDHHGGKLLSGVSSKLDYLIVGDEAGSKLEKARKIPSIKILSESEFLKMIKS
ncbi:MAG: helix-hairpin-helix domain-containing protein, partial [Chitinophagaceae bacterium]